MESDEINQYAETIFTNLNTKKKEETILEVILNTDIDKRLGSFGSEWHIVQQVLYFRTVNRQPCTSRGIGIDELLRLLRGLFILSTVLVRFFDGGFDELQRELFRLIIRDG